MQIQQHTLITQYADLAPLSSYKWVLFDIKYEFTLMDLHQFRFTNAATPYQLPSSILSQR